MNCESDSDSESGGEKITLSSGLSPEAMAALFQFIKPQSVASEEPDTEVMSQVIEASLQKNLPDPSRSDVSIVATDPHSAVEIFKQYGVVRLNNVLNTEACDRCLFTINEQLASAVDAGVDHFTKGEETGFGNVDSKENRWDMYLNYSGEVKESLQCIFDEASSPLTAFFRELFDGKDASFHELSALVCDKGAFTQRVHADTTYQAECPLFTVFVAVQEVAQGMGPTLFIPGSHTAEAHRELRYHRQDYLTVATYQSGHLQKGDCVVMDSRTLHCGDANTESRRALFYFTLLNPNFTDMGGGSMFKDLNLNLHDIPHRS
jgi:hypothetical protein